MTLRIFMSRLGSRKGPRLGLVVLACALLVTYFQNCTPMGDAEGVGMTDASSLSAPSPNPSPTPMPSPPPPQCAGRVGPTISGSGSALTAQSGLGGNSGNNYPQNININLTLGYPTQNLNDNCTVNGIAGLNVNCNVVSSTVLEVDLTSNQECISGSGTISLRVSDNICGFTSNTITIPVTVTNVCPAEYKVVNPDPERNDQFASRVAISGNTAVVIATSDNQKAQDAGAAYVLNWNGSSWVVAQKLMPTALGALSEIYSVTVDGNILALGAPYHGSYGTVFVYRYNGSSWVESETLTPSQTNPAIGTQVYGFDVALKSGILAVGSPGYARGNPASLSESGGVFVYQDSGVFTQSAVLTSSDGVAYDGFGVDVAVSAGRVVVGAPVTDGGNISGLPGRAYVYAAGSYLETKLTPSNIGNGSRFGMAVDIDGSRIAVGAPGADGRGAVVVFENGATKITGAGIQSGDSFGSSVALRGNNLLVGAPARDVKNTDQAGSAYLMRFDGSTWRTHFEMFPRGSGRGVQDRFGESIGLDGSFMIGGSRLDDEGELNTGTAFLIRVP